VNRGLASNIEIWNLVFIQYNRSYSTRILSPFHKTEFADVTKPKPVKKIVLLIPVHFSLDSDFSIYL
jgi:hypothetical protein